MQAVLEETSEPEPGTEANDFKIKYKASARDALNSVQQEFATREKEKTKLELKNERAQGQLNALETAEI